MAHGESTILSVYSQRGSILALGTRLGKFISHQSGNSSQRRHPPATKLRSISSPSQVALPRFNKSPIAVVA